MAAPRLRPSESSFPQTDAHDCNAFATLAFGIVVNVLDLCLAGSASASLRPSLLGINLILARKRKGRLETSVDDGNVDVCALPVEIWDIIKMKLTSRAYADEYRRWELYYHPDVATDEYWARDKQLERDEEPHTFASIVLPEDSSASHSFIVQGGVLKFVFLHDHGKDVDRLLASFGLCRPLHSVVSGEGWETTCDLDSRWVVALPLVADDRAFYPSVHTDIERDIVAYDSVRFSRISPSTFLLPDDARGRFRRLLASFPALTPRPVPMTVSTIRTPDEDVSTAADTGNQPSKGDAGPKTEACENERRRARERVERQEASEPAWMLAISYRQSSSLAARSSHSPPPRLVLGPVIMCFSTSTPFYGLTVKALDLCIAGMAFSEIKPTLLGINLILARKAAGTLATTAVPGTVDVGALPVEVWDLVTLKLCALSYVHEYAGLEGKYHPSWSVDSYWEEDEQARADEPLTFNNLLSNDWGFRNFFDEGGVRAFIDEHEKDVPKLLKYFGLCMASSALISKTGEEPYFDFDIAWPVAIPPVGEKSHSYPTVAASIAHDDESSHRVSRISPSAFELPVGAAGRFRRLLASFPAVSPIPTWSDTIRSPTEPTSTLVDDDKDADGDQEPRFRSIMGGQELRARETERRHAKERAERKAASVPAWMLWGGGRSCT
ncbi:hypothetical protein JCM8208_004737 [Rhodotorula glutinis]